MAAAVHFERGLVPGLNSYQILFITISGIIGIGFATTTGEALAISGPGGVLIAFAVVGVVAIAVMEGICEMIVLWPIANAMIEFVRAFVDEDLAIVVGIAYWYTYTVTLAALIIGTANLLKYWHIEGPQMTGALIGMLGFVFLVNCLGVKRFGWIELFGGILKLLLVFGVFLIMLLINQGNIGNVAELGNEPKIGSIFYNDGVRNNPNVASSHFTAVLVCIPIAIFAYIGVELVTVCAFEARTPSKLKLPAKNIAYLMTAIYLFIIGGIVANVEWFNSNLQNFLEQARVNPDSTNADLGHTPWKFIESNRSTVAPVIAVLQVGIPNLPGVIVGFLFYSGISCATTTLYVASRTLYGLTRDLSQTDPNFFVSFFARFNTVSSGQHVPVWALIASLFFISIWLPFVKLDSKATQNEVQETLVAIGSVGAVLVWASQCLAFIRYNRWLYKHRDRLPNFQRGKYVRGRGFHSYGSSLQPFPAYVGLISCLVVVFVLNSVSMYNRSMPLFKALTIYLGPALLLLIFVILKIKNQRKWIMLSDDWEDLRETLNRLTSLIYVAPSEDGINVPEDQIIELVYQNQHGHQHPPPPPEDQPYIPSSPPPQNGNIHPSQSRFPNGAPIVRTTRAGVRIPPTADELQHQSSNMGSGYQPYTDGSRSENTYLGSGYGAELGGTELSRQGSAVSAESDFISPDISYHTNAPPPLNDNSYLLPQNIRLQTPGTEQTRDVSPMIGQMAALRNQSPSQNQTPIQNLGLPVFSDVAYASGSEERGNSRSPFDRGRAYRDHQPDRRQGSVEMSKLSPVSPEAGGHDPYIRSAS